MLRGWSVTNLVWKSIKKYQKCRLARFFLVTYAATLLVESGGTFYTCKFYDTSIMKSVLKEAPRLWAIYLYTVSISKNNSERWRQWCLNFGDCTLKSNSARRRKLQTLAHKLLQFVNHRLKIINYKSFLVFF